MENLPLFHRLAGKKVVVLGAGEAAAAKARLVERAGGIVVGEAEAADARMAFVAMDEPEAAAARLRAAGLLVNVVDRADLCDFTVPSILDRSPVLVAVGTGGASAGLAKALRLRLEGLLPQGLGALATALSEARAAMRARWADGGARRRALDAALSVGGVLDPLADGAAARVADWLASAGEGAATTQEFRLNSPDADDLTLRQARHLGSADIVAHEPGVPTAVLNRARADAVRLLIEPGAEAPAPQPGQAQTVVRAAIAR